MRQSEKAIQNETLVALSELPETLVFRNNTGSAWQGRRVKLPVGSMVEVEDGMVILRNARPVRFGLEGSADIVGSHKGHALMTEIKAELGVQAQVQRDFEVAWKKAGGIYIIARSPSEAIEKLHIELLLKA